MKKKAVYISYTGILEPLGRSQVLSYLFRLSDNYSFVLISFEKSSDLDDTESVKSLKEECKRYGVNWQPRRYHHRPRLLATFWDMLVLTHLTLRSSWRADVQVVHARSYIPSMCAWLCGLITRVPFIFDMRALWPDEMVSAGRLKKHSLMHRALKILEKRLLKDAGAVVSLTEAAVGYLTDVYPGLDKNKFHVITTCVDLARFNVADKPRPNKENGIVVGTMGTVLGGWYHLSWLFTIFLEIEKRLPGSVLKVVTKDDHQVIRKQAELAGIDSDKVSLVSCKPHEVPGHIVDFDVAVLFFIADIGKIGSAPTRMGEILASGIPILGNAGVGDMADLIRRYDVGVTVQSGSGTELKQAATQIVDYIADQSRTSVCRFAATDYFSVESGAAHYREIYNSI